MRTGSPRYKTIRPQPKFITDFPLSKTFDLVQLVLRICRVEFSEHDKSVLTPDTCATYTLTRVLRSFTVENLMTAWKYSVVSVIYYNHLGVVVINTLRQRQNGRHFPDDMLKWIFLNENVWNTIKISLKFAPTSPINNIPALVQIMAWRQPGAKPLFEPMMDSLLTHIWVTRPQWVKPIFSVLLIYLFSKSIKILVTYWILCSYWTGIITI